VPIIEELRKYISVVPYRFKSGENFEFAIFFLIAGVLQGIDGGIIVVRIQVEPRYLFFSAYRIESGCNRPPPYWMLGMKR